jgi:membrane protein DedA with SNARE-associated domain
MWWQYALVFLGAFVFDVVPFPFPPAFTIMVFFQVLFGLDTWPVIIIGVIGSVFGRYILTLYIPYFADRIFKKSKNDDVVFLGEQMKQQFWKGQLAILAYTLLPLPTTPIFLATGMSRINAAYVIPMFFVGKFTSDAITVHLGNYVSQNAENFVSGSLTWQGALGLVVGTLFLCAVLFINWRALIQQKRFLLNFRIWKRSGKTVETVETIETVETVEEEVIEKDSTDL